MKKSPLIRRTLRDIFLSVSLLTASINPACSDQLAVADLQKITPPTKKYGPHKLSKETVQELMMSWHHPDIELKDHPGIPQRIKDVAQNLLDKAAQIYPGKKPPRILVTQPPENRIPIIKGLYQPHYKHENPDIQAAIEYRRDSVRSFPFMKHMMLTVYLENLNKAFYNAEEKAIRISESLFLSGEKAISGLIAHEIGHHYYNNAYVFLKEGMPEDEKNNVFKSKKINERLADIFSEVLTNKKGSVFEYLSFKRKRDLPEALKKIILSLGNPEKGNSTKKRTHPTDQERKELEEYLETLKFPEDPKDIRAFLEAIKPHIKDENRFPFIGLKTAKP